MTDADHGPDRAAVEVPASDVPADELRRLHPLTPLLRSWRIVGAAGALGFGVFRDQFDRVRWFWDAAHGDVDTSVLLKGFVVVLAIAVVAVVASWLAWRVTGFAIVTDERGVRTLLYQRGLFVRQRRQVRLNRVQSVDVNQPFYARPVGLALVRLDMAAGEGASVDLSFLRASEAWELRAEILPHTSVGPKARANAAEPAVPDTLIAQVSTTQVVCSTLLDGVLTWSLTLVWLLGIGVAVVVWGSAAIVAGLSGIVIVTIALLAQTRRQVLEMFRDANFRLYRTATGVRLSSGLTSTINRTIDHDRIQGVRVEEPWLWRRLGWARVRLDIAGARGDDEPPASLIPVADRAAAYGLVADVTGVDLDLAAYAGPGQRSRVVDPVGASFLGVALLAHGAARREGRWRRSTSYVPFARVQSVSARQGLLQRQLGLATLHLDLPKGAGRWTARHRGTPDAARLVQVLSARAREHRLSESSSA